MAPRVILALAVAAFGFVFVSELIDIIGRNTPAGIALRNYAIVIGIAAVIVTGIGLLVAVFF